MALRLLIVDDNEQFLEIARFLLERDGIDVVGTTTTADDALEQVREHNPNAVLVDINLGRDSGFELTRRLVALPGHALQVVLVSTLDELDFAELIEESPAAGFVPKRVFSARAVRCALAEAA
jgi:CheY-like chemotaxis protein